MAVYKVSRKNDCSEKVKISEDLLLIKDLISRPVKIVNPQAEINQQIQNLGQKVNMIEKSLKDSKAKLDPKKIKEMLILLESGEMTSTDVGSLLKMSRNRSTEYLRQMERGKVVLSRYKGKKKYYCLPKKEYD